MTAEETILDHPEDQRKQDYRTRVRAIGLSVLVSLILMAAKFYVYRITGSSAILSDALESIINVVASIFALASIIIAAIPPDQGHPYGHGKIENFSAGFEGALIIIAALGIFKVGVENILQPRPLPRLETGLLILLGTSIVNFLLGVLLVRVGRRTRSVALVADGKHVLTDVLTSAGVLAGLLAVHLTGWYRLDWIIACLVGIHIIFSGVGLLRESFAGLMDASDPALLDEITDLIARNRRPGWIDIHELRAWRAGSDVHIDLHLILNRETTLENAHRKAQELEDLLKENIDGAASILIHMDPCMDQECPICSQSICSWRMDEHRNRIEWTRESLTSSGSPGDRFNRKETEEDITEEPEPPSSETEI